MFVKPETLVREPEGIDFVVDSRPLKGWEKKMLSEIIEHYKKTGKIKKITTTKKTRKKEFV